MSDDIFIGRDGNEWIYIKGRMVPKKELEEANNKLVNFTEETEKEYNKRQLNWRKYEKFQDNERI